jgi:predicted AlkP superfamily pyrophosphatase or phosphodiesterase
LLVSACSARATLPPAAAPAEEPGVVILVSIDGFRADYLQHHEVPHLRRLAAEGVHAPAGMIPVFPSLTFPNHYSIVTGLYPEHHGIVANTIYDPEWDAWFRIRDRSAIEDQRWWGGEPIWVTAQRQGLRSATFFWVGSEAPIQGIRPTYWKKFDTSIPSSRRVDQVLHWLDLPTAERPSLITLYFGEIDSKSHRYGPDSAQVAEALGRVDAHLGRLIRGLEERELLGRVNVVVVSDHGMAATSSERLIVLDERIDLADVQIVNLSPVLMLRPRAGKFETVRQALVGAHPHLAVYRREEIPARLHFRDNRRITPLVGLADEGWSIVASRESRQPPRGMHGYDNALESMRALFVAHGPAFWGGIEIEPFEIVHLYELLAAVLGLDPAPNDGSPQALRGVLREGSPVAPTTGETPGSRNRR